MWFGRLGGAGITDSHGGGYGFPRRFAPRNDGGGVGQAQGSLPWHKTKVFVIARAATRPVAIRVPSSPARVLRIPTAGGTDSHGENKERTPTASRRRRPPCRKCHSRACFADGPPMARLRKFRAAFLCHRQRRPEIPLRKGSPGDGGDGLPRRLRLLAMTKTLDFCRCRFHGIRRKARSLRGLVRSGVDASRRRKRQCSMIPAASSSSARKRFAGFRADPFSGLWQSVPLASGMRIATSG